MENHSNDQTSLEKFLLIDKIMELTGKSRPTIYRWIQSNQFPAPYKVGGSSLWKVSDYVEWAENLKRVN